MQALPVEIQAFIDAVKSIGGVESVEPVKWYLPDITLDQLSLTLFADLPLAVLRRSRGAVGDEVLIAFVIRPERNTRGWNAIEFLSWWVRDAARSGHTIQIRSIALPPEIDGRVQLGHTLKFVLEFFVADENQDIEKLLAVVKRHADALAFFRTHYASAIDGAAL